MLSVSGLEVAFGKRRILSDINFDVPTASTVAIVGPNGSGKSTLVRALSSGTGRYAGEIRLSFGDRELNLTRLNPWERARVGLLSVPSEGHVFDSLTVRENLRVPGAALGARTGERDRAIGVALNDLPLLAGLQARTAATLSGGERRLLGIARVLVQGSLLHRYDSDGSSVPVLVLDEPTSGLSPASIRLVEAALRSVQARGWSILLVEQMLAFAAGIADTILVMSRGRIAQRLDSTSITSDAALYEDLLVGRLRGAQQ